MKKRYEQPIIDIEKFYGAVVTCDASEIDDDSMIVEF